MRVPWVRLAAAVALCVQVSTGAAKESPVAESDYVGNVYGAVRDAATGRGLRGAEVILLARAVGKAAAEAGLLLDSNRGPIALSEEIFSSPLRAFCDPGGAFLINNVPTPFPFKPYTIVARAPGYQWQILDQIPVLPGATMALEVRFTLSGAESKAEVFDRADPDAPFQYRHERAVAPLSAKPPPPASTAPLAQVIFATREGLVGGTTANGHVIQPRDHFVALPSRRALSSNGGREFQVQLSHQGRSVVAPIWDVGPWNIRDDYWNPSSLRQMWQELPQGLPQAQAAFQNGFNGGRDEFGRTVTNPAGIDLADGTFWDDLEMAGSGWIEVEYLWLASQEPGALELNISRSDLCAGDPWELQVSSGAAGNAVLLSGWKDGSALFASLPVGTADGTGRWSLSGTIPPGFEGSWHEQVTVGGKKSNFISFSVGGCSGDVAPVISTDRPFYCVGEPWRLAVRGKASSPVDLHGASGSVSWNIAGWARTDGSGRHIAAGRMQPGDAGSYGLYAVISGKPSNRIGFLVSKCVD